MLLFFCLLILKRSMSLYSLILILVGCLPWRRCIPGSQIAARLLGLGSTRGRAGSRSPGCRRPVRPPAPGGAGGLRRLPGIGDRPHRGLCMRRRRASLSGRAGANTGLWHAGAPRCRRRSASVGSSWMARPPMRGR